MPKRMREEDLQEILEIIKLAQPQSVALRDITAQLANPPSKSTLQRRIARLLEKKSIEAEGAGPSKKYCLAVAENLAPTSSIPLSSEAKTALRYIQQPVMKRKPVGYQDEFLLSYQPNETFYLADETRDALQRLGKGHDFEKPSGTHAKRIYERLLIDLSWNSSRLEGNTYSLLETENLLQHAVPATGKDPKETQMILNHKAAIDQRFVGGL